MQNTWVHIEILTHGDIVEISSETLEMWGCFLRRSVWEASDKTLHLLSVYLIKKQLRNEKDLICNVCNQKSEILIWTQTFSTNSPIPIGFIALYFLCLICVSFYCLQGI